MGISKMQSFANDGTPLRSQTIYHEISSPAQRTDSAAEDHGSRAPVADPIENNPGLFNFYDNGMQTARRARFRENEKEEQSPPGWYIPHFQEYIRKCKEKEDAKPCQKKLDLNAGGSSRTKILTSPRPSLSPSRRRQERPRELNFDSLPRWQ